MPIIITELAIQSDGTWAVEIYNQGPGSEDLSNFQIGSQSGAIGNGFVPLSGTLPSGGTIVVGHSSIPGVDLSPADGAFDDTPIQLIRLRDANTFNVLDNIGQVNGTDLGTDVVYEGSTARAPDTNPTTSNLSDFTSTAGFANNTLGTPCFAAGTLIATPAGEVPVEALQIGDLVLTADGRAVPVLWIGRRMLRGVRDRSAALVRIGARALGDGLPHSDLTVTGDHGMILGGLVVNAAVLVDHGSIRWVPAAEAAGVTVYHLETEAHDVILANGAATESYIDYAGRRAFDNFEQYLALFGAERIFPEMALARITRADALPAALGERLAGGAAGGLRKAV